MDSKMKSGSEIVIRFEDHNAYSVRCGNQEAIKLGFDEMLGTVAQLTMRDRNCLGYMRAIDITTSEPESEAKIEVRWYLDEDTCLRGYGKDSIWIRPDGKLGKNQAPEDICIKDRDTKLSTAEVLCMLARKGFTDAWDAARKLAGMTPKEAYAAGQSACGIGVGDLVRVSRKARYGEMGWIGEWKPTMYVGSEITIGIMVELGCCANYGNAEYPFFVLEKVEQPAVKEAAPEPKSDWIRILAKWGEIGKEPVRLISVTAEGEAIADVTGIRRTVDADSFEYVTQVIRPWTFMEACEAVAKNGDAFKVDGLTVHVAAVRIGNICFKEGHAPKFETLANGETEWGTRKWTLANGEPCGVVEWETVK